MLEKKHVLCIDPGVGGTGIAIWTEENFEQSIWMPEYHKSFRKKSEYAYYDFFKQLHKEYNFTQVYIENAHYHGSGSGKGQMVAEKGDLVVLAKFIGGLDSLFYFLEVPVIDVVNVTTWKGQLPKEVVMRRILKVWPECPSKQKNEKPTGHDWDAIGIGFWKMGVINQ